MLKEVLQQALKTKGPSIVNIPIDYSDNPQLFKTVHTRYLGH
jgi:thiamine pyrophosphate-dependent acetolactate synthase large subunit-like protein